MSTNIKGYKDSELISLAKGAKSFTHIPKNHWILAMRSIADDYNSMDDKIYAMYGEKCISVMTGTTNGGTYGLKNFMKWDSRGMAVIKSGVWNYDCYKKSDGKIVRHHNSKLQCLRLVKPIWMHRDGNKNKKVEEYGKAYFENNGTNFHLNSYKMLKGITSWLINGWSTGCIVPNDATKYWKFLEGISYDEEVSLLVLKST